MQSFKQIIIDESKYTLVCERASLLAQKDPTGNYELQKLIRANWKQISPYMSKAVDSLSSLCIGTFTTNSRIECIKIKALFLSVLDCLTETTEPSAWEYRCAKKLYKIVKANYDFVRYKVDADRLVQDQTLCMAFGEYSITQKEIPYISVEDFGILSLRAMLYYLKLIVRGAEQCGEYDETDFVCAALLLIVGSYLKNDSVSYLLAKFPNMAQEHSPDGEFDESVFLDAKDEYENVSSAYTSSTDAILPFVSNEIQNPDDTAFVLHTKDEIDIAENCRVLSAMLCSINTVYAGDLLEHTPTQKEVSQIADAITDGMVFKKTDTELLDAVFGKESNDNSADFLSIRKYYSQTIQSAKQTLWLTKNFIEGIKKLAYAELKNDELTKANSSARAKPSDACQDKDVCELRKKLDSSENTVSKLFEEKQSAKKRADCLSDKLESAEQEKKMLLQEIERLKTLVADRDEDDADEVLVDEVIPEPAVEKSPDLSDEEVIAAAREVCEKKKIVIVGGNTNLLKKIKMELPALVVMESKRNSSVEGTIQYADYVFFRYSALSHKLYLRVKTACESNNIPYYYFSSATSVRLLAEEIISNTNKEETQHE